MAVAAHVCLELPQGVRKDVVDRRGRKLELTEIAPLLARIVEAWRPYQIWLFGSRARGEADSAETANTLAYEAVKRGVLLYEC